MRFRFVLFGVVFPSIIATIATAALISGASLQAEGNKHSLTTILFGNGKPTKKEPPSEFYYSAFKDSDNKDKSSSGTSEERKKDKPGEWEEEDFGPLYPELRVLDQVSSKKSLEKLQQAVAFYNISNNRLHVGQEKIKLKKLEWAGEQHRYAWIGKDRARQQEQAVERIRSRYRNEALANLLRAMNILGGIKNPDIVKSKQYMDLKSKIYIQYVKLQFRARNLGACISVLEDYLKIRPEHLDDPEPHRLLAAAYRHRESLARHMNNTEAFFQYKKRKNKHLIRFVELKFGKTSPEYQEISKQVKRDMIDVSSPTNTSD